MAQPMTRRWRLARLVAWIALAAATAWAWGASTARPSRPAAPSGVVALHDLAYRADDGQRLALDLYLPENPKPDPGAASPLLIAVHGGSWIGGSKSEYGPQFARLAQNGVAVAVVDYRLARPGSPSWPDAPGDIIAALDWLETRSARYRIDPGRVAAVGTSSGGLLATLAGFRDPRIRGVVCLSAPMDLAALMAERPLTHDPALAFIGDDPEGLVKRARDASPISLVQPGGPPMLLIHGTDDRWVSIEQARNMRGVLEEWGVPHRFIGIEGARHGFQLLVQEPQSRDLAPEVLDFLRKVWGASPDPLPPDRGVSFLKSTTEGETMRAGFS